MNQIDVSTEKCRRCYGCIKTCPSEAIKGEKGDIKIIHERCILCGSCIKTCPQDALIYESGLSQVEEFLQTNEKTVAVLDPAFPGVLDIGTPQQLVTALKKLGFVEVWEGAFGVELVSRAYKRLLQNQTKRTIISSFCPAIVLYVQKYLPQLIPNLAPIVSPMIATGRVIRKIKGPEWKIVYITSCLAQFGEMNAPEVSGAIDHVITFLEARDLFEKAGINRRKQEKSNFDGPAPYLGRIFPVIGGLYRCMGENFDVLMDEISVTGGRVRSLRALNQLVAGHIEAKFLDLAFCEGCVDGPFVDRDIFVLGRRQIVARYAKQEMNRQNQDDVMVEVNKHKNIDLTRSFLNLEEKLPIPSEKEIQQVLEKIDKAPPDKNLDCLACGYSTCREKAIAVTQGLAELEMCLPYLLEKTRKIFHQLEKSHEKLQSSHQELEQAQEQLIKTEKLASLGQLAAGVAHEINNPLSTITMFSHILKKTFDKDDQRYEDIQLIIDEADRTKNIVQGLLSFARENKLRPGQTDINELLEEILGLVINQSLFHNIKIEKIFDPNLQTTYADSTQLKQVFLNIVLNAAQAMDGKGKITITTEQASENGHLIVQIQDSGPGVPPEIMGKLFDPFVTTKEKGTGLGLAISYGIMERHMGDITVQSEFGKGTTFTISMPILENAEQLNQKNNNITIGR